MTFELIPNGKNMLEIIVGAIGALLEKGIPIHAVDTDDVLLLDEVS